MKYFLGLIIALSAIALLLTTLFSFFGERFYVSELLSHFRVQYICLFLIAAIYFACLNRKWLVVAIVGLIVNGASVLPIYFPQIATETTSDARYAPDPLSLIFANVYTSSRDEELLFNVIASKQADLIILDEYSDRLTNVFKKLEANYPFQNTLPEWQEFGMAIYSKFPLHDVKFEGFVTDRTPGISVSITLNDRKLRIIAVHPAAPVSPFRASRQRLYFKNLTKAVTLEDGPVIVAGDFNSSMWSPRYRKLIRDTGLVNARRGKGIYPTWSPNWRLAPFLSIPIDHILVSSELDAVNFETLPFTGSEHLPIYAEINY